MLDVAKRFNPEYFNNFCDKDFKAILDCLNFYDNVLSDIVNNNDLEFDNAAKCVNLYYGFLHSLFPEEAGDDLIIFPNPDLRPC